MSVANEWREVYVGGDQEFDGLHIIVDDIRCHGPQQHKAPG
jgi:hypothetical protein